MNVSGLVIADDSLQLHLQVICADLQVRDITTNEELQDAMHLSVPVLAVLDEQGGEVCVPLDPWGYVRTACATTA
jgi:hypothetical protein